MMFNKFAPYSYEPYKRRRRLELWRRPRKQTRIKKSLRNSDTQRNRRKKKRQAAKKSRRKNRK